MTTVHGTPDGQVLVLCKGAPEVLLQLLDDDPSLAHDQVARLAARGLRVLAVAGAIRTAVPRDVGEAEQGLRLLGLVGLQDPPREAARAAVARCRTAGVVPIMITGDHPATAAAIARDVGILDDPGQVATGADIAAGLTPEQLQGNRVYARTAPEQKLDIVAALQAAGHVVAMTGDGVNDAPALRAADVGVAMGRSGTEVARQAADIVLVDDDFATMVAAVEEGRRVYDNVRRFLLYALSGGTAEVLLMLLGPAFGLPLPLLPGQILWVNMLTHGLPGVALGAEQAEDDVLDRPPRRPGQGVLGEGLGRRIALLALVVTGAALGVGVVADRSGHPWQSMVFVTLTLAQLGVALSLRSQQRSVLSVGLRGNPLLLGSVALNVGLLWLAVGWHPLRELLGTSPLSAGELGGCLLASLAAPAWVELSKLVPRGRARLAQGTFDPAAHAIDSSD
jgi:Ca2+-transporting ATPase